MAEIKDPENTIIMETTKGRVVIELRPDVAPGHVARIKELTREGAYDGVVFHRVIHTITDVLLLLRAPGFYLDMFIATLIVLAAIFNHLIERRGLA